MRRWSMIAILWLPLLAGPALAQTSAAPPEPENTGIHYVTASALNVRLGPGADSRAAKSLQRGEKVFVFEVKDGWARISKPFSGKTVGQPGMVSYWVSMTYLSREEPETN